jgi:hypothetical protein
MLGTRASALALTYRAGKKSKSGLFFWRSKIVSTLAIHFLKPRKIANSSSAPLACCLEKKGRWPGELLRGDEVIYDALLEVKRF